MRPQYAHAMAWSLKDKTRPKYKASLAADRCKHNGAPADALYWHRDRWITWADVTNTESRDAVLYVFLQHGWGHPDREEEK